MLCPIGQSNEKPPLQALAKWGEHVTVSYHLFFPPPAGEELMLLYTKYRSSGIVLPKTAVFLFAATTLS